MIPIIQTELDALRTEPVELHCIGGFVVCFFYGLQRTAGDLDFQITASYSIRLSFRRPTANL